MVINFKTRWISRSTRKLTQTLMLIKKNQILKNYLDLVPVIVSIHEQTSSCITNLVKSTLY